MKTKGHCDVSIVSNVANISVMEQKDEEYGSHDKTFDIPAVGVVIFLIQ